MDENNWAITLIKEKKRFHALLIFEGVGPIEEDNNINALNIDSFRDCKAF